MLKSIVRKVAKIGIELNVLLLNLVKEKFN
jgi:hypothetical protein